jgi:hypothetical protein
MKIEELDEMQRDWQRMLAEESEIQKEDEDQSIGRRFVSCCGAFLAFMALDGDTRERLRTVIRLSKSSDESKRFARIVLNKAFSEDSAQPT